MVWGEALAAAGLSPVRRDTTEQPVRATSSAAPQVTPATARTTRLSILGSSDDGRRVAVREVPWPLGLDASQVAGLGCRFVLGQRDRSRGPIGDGQPVQGRDRGVQRGKGVGHLLAQVGDEDGGVQRLAQLSVVLAAPLLEVLGQVFIGLRQESAPTTQISLHRSCSRSAWKVTTS